ncbi:hypothetical protein FXO37_34007 [Capsicum annuum]|nr:hypothetical protein FXO37_34007 [Capsicum annuum]
MTQHANRSCSVRENQSKNLLTDEVPSFSLGLTQDEVFYLGSTNVFSKEGVTIEELRSKHRNDPEKIFALVTGLNCATNKDEFVFDEETPNKIIDQYFDGEFSNPSYLNWKTNSPRPRYETLMGSMFDDTDEKVVFKNIEPSRKEISAFHIANKFVPRYASHNEDDIDSDDDFQDPSQRQNQFTTKKKHHGDFSASPVKKKMKPHPKGVDELISKQTLSPRAAKMAFVKTPIHKPIQIKVTMHGNRKDINQPDSKKSIPVQPPAPSSFSSEDENGVVSKKVFDKFCEKVWQEFNDVHGLVSSRFDQMMNAINENKVAKEMAGYQSNSMNDVYNEIDGYNEDNDIVLITKSVDESIGEAQISESQLTFSDDVLRSIDLDSITKANVEVEDEFKTKEGAIEMNVNTPAGHESEVDDVDNSKLDQQYKSAVHISARVNVERNADQHLSDSQSTLSDELLPSLNAYVNLEQSIIVHPSANQAQQMPMHVSRIRNNKEEHYLKEKAKIPVINFGILSVEDKNWFYVMGTPSQTWSDEQINVCLYYLRKKFKYDLNISYKFSTVDCNFMNIVTTVFDVYKLNDETLNAGGKKYHLNEYISGFRMHATVSWHTVDHMFIPVHINAKHHWVLAVISFNHRCIYVYDSLSAAGHDAAVLTEIEKLAKIIPICLIECKFYENKGIDIDNHPNYKLNDKMDPFGVSIVENVPQQPSGSLDCGLYMVTYTECLTFGEAVPFIDFDPDLIRIRYASLLWDYGNRKANAKAQSDDDAPMRPLRITELIEGTEVVDI